MNRFKRHDQPKPSNQNKCKHVIILASTPSFIQKHMFLGGQAFQRKKTKHRSLDPALAAALAEDLA